MKSKLLNNFIANRQEMLDATKQLDMSVFDNDSKELMESAMSDLVYTIDVLTAVQKEIESNG